jgi:hypothetical protein
MWSTNSLQPYRPPTSSTADTADSSGQASRLQSFELSLVPNQNTISERFIFLSTCFRCRTSGTYCLKTRDRRRGKQKAPNKPCTPHKKKGVAAWAVAKKPSLLARRRTSFCEVTFRPSTPGSTRWLCMEAQMLLMKVEYKCNFGN